MKIRTKISFVMALVMIVSSFTIVGTATDPFQKGTVIFTKEVWDSDAEEWVNDIESQVGEDVRFRINLTFYNITAGYSLYNIEIKDHLPECLEFNNNVSSPETYTENVDGKWINWTFSGLSLHYGENVYIEFNATVIQSEELNNQNWAYLEAVECGQYDHEACDDAWVNITVTPPPEPSIDIDKQVYDPEIEEWVDDELTTYICVYDLLNDGQYIDFKINVTNTGNVDLDNVLVTDVLPEFLMYWSSTPGYTTLDDQKITWEIGTITEEGYFVIYLTAKIRPLAFLFDDMVEGDNYVNATDTQYPDVFAEDSVHLIIWKQLSVVKDVWDPDSQSWVNELEEVRIGQKVTFRITTTYHGAEGDMLDCMLVGDLLPDDCLEYLETTEVKVRGNTITPGSTDYPYIIPDAGTTLTLCDEEVTIPDMIDCDFGCCCGGDECYAIIWDFRSATGFDLLDGQSVVIEFETEVANYCESCECVSTDVAFAVGWGCYLCDECNYYLDWDYANVSCCPPDTRFEKKVQVGKCWEDEGTGFVDETMRFKLEFEYYGNENLTDVRFKDQLPCVLVFADNVDSNLNVTVDVSPNGKIIWFNSSEDEVSDGDIITIEFDALVTGVTSDCSDCLPKNKAWLYIYDGCPLELIETYYDEVDITTVDNAQPCPPIIRESTEGETGEELTFYVKTTDFDGDLVMYGIDWDDDNTVDEWTSYYPSGVEVELTKVFGLEGAYKVKAKAKDVNGKTGDWGNTITVVIEDEEPPEEEEDLEIVAPMMFNIATVGAGVKNIGTMKLYDINWNFTIYKEGVLGSWQIKNNGTIDELAKDKTETIQSKQVTMKFGKATIEIEATSGELEESITKEAFVLGKLVLVL